MRNTSFDLMSDYLNTFNKGMKSVSNISNFPFFDIKKGLDGNYLLDISVAGFSKSELEVEVDKGILSVKGIHINKEDSDNPYDFIHKGISTKDFNKVWMLDPSIDVDKVSLDNGILSISLNKVKSEKGKKLKIN